MRFGLPKRHALFFICVFALAMLALFPMQLGLSWLNLDERGVAAREARGSIWNGQLIEAQFGDAQLGSIDAGLGFFPLLIGNARLAMERDPQAGDGISPGDFRGAITVSGANIGIDDLTALLDSPEIFAPLPVTRLNLEDLTAHFDNGVCMEAEGSVRITLANTLEGIPLPTTATGAARCEDGVLLLPMIGQSGMEQVNIRIGSNGAFTAELSLRPGDDNLRDTLLANGFRPSGNGYALVIAGQL